MSGGASVHELHLGGGKGDDAWTKADSVDLLMDLHLDADRPTVEAELRVALARGPEAQEAAVAFTSRRRSV